MKKNNIQGINNGQSKINYSFSSVFIHTLNLSKKVNRRVAWFTCLIAIIVSCQTAFAQTSNVKIIVKDNSGKLLEGVLIQSVGKNAVSATTDKTGTVTLNLPANSLVKLRLNNYQKTVEVKSDEVNVRLTDADKNLALGFGISESADEVTSSISTVYASKLEKSSLNNPTESLFGQLTGLMVLQNAGEPWNRNASISIRGTATLGNNSPLTIVDGFERDLSSLSLADIESISVLKDGTALARYGQRGANGVILVTTKRGMYNTSRVKISFDQGLNFALRKPQFLNSYDYAKSVNEASILDGNAPVYSDRDLTGFQTNENPYLLPNVNWYNEVMKDYGKNANLNTSFYGGGKSMRYYAAVNYQNERGLFKNFNTDNRYDSQIKYDRLNFRTNLDVDLTKTTKFLLNVAGNVNAVNQPGATIGGVMNAIYSVPSAAFPVKTQDGQWGGTSFYDNNPVALVASTGVRQPNGRQIMGNMTISQDLNSWLKGLSADASVAYDNNVDYYENKIRSFLYENVAYARDPSTGDINYTNATLYGSNTDLTYSHSFGDQFREATLYGKVNYDTKFHNSSLKTSLMYQQTKSVRDGQYNTFLRQNMFASASYSLKDRYFVDGVLSYSGTSVLPKGNRFSFFPAISAGWLVNREDFLKDSKAINYLKLRASWGMSGNDIMAPNLAQQAFAAANGYYFGINNGAGSGINEGRLADAGLTSEKSLKSNIGIDMNLFHQLSVTVDAFYDKRKDILVSTAGSIPSTLGVTPAIANDGIVTNKGIEGSLLWKKEIRNSKFYVGGNITFAKNKIVNMDEAFQPYAYLKQTGNPVGQQFGLQAIGFFKNQADINNSPKQLFANVSPGDIKYKDQNNDGVIDNLDIMPMGYANNTPEIYYGLSLGYDFKNFGFNVVLQGIANKTLYLNTKSLFWPLLGNSTISSFSANSWTPETAATATLPRLSLLANDNNYRKNDIWLKSGDYLKIRQIDIHFNFPQRLANKVKLQNAQLYLRAFNVYSFDHIKVADPESIGIDYPTLATYNLGIKLEF